MKEVFVVKNVSVDLYYLSKGVYRTLLFAEQFDSYETAKTAISEEYSGFFQIEKLFIKQ